VAWFADERCEVQGELGPDLTQEAFHNEFGEQVAIPNEEGFEIERKPKLSK